MEPKTGGCLCKAVRFTAAAVEPHHDACHCGMCRRWAGGPALTTVARGVVFEKFESLATYRSSKWAERGFCRTCGSSLFYHLLPADQYFMCVGAFDDAAQFRLTREIFIDHKPQGYEFAGEHPRLTEAETLAQYGA